MTITLQILAAYLVCGFLDLVGWVGFGGLRDLYLEEGGYNESDWFLAGALIALWPVIAAWFAWYGLLALVVRIRH